jgi:hypothetical protein
VLSWESLTDLFDSLTWWLGWNWGWDWCWCWCW